MADLIGGVAPYLGTNNLIVGTADTDNIFGDPYTTGNYEGLPEIGGVLSSGRGGNDRLEGLGGGDIIVGDAGLMDGTATGGNDFIDGGDGDDLISSATRTTACPAMLGVGRPYRRRCRQRRAVRRFRRRVRHDRRRPWRQ